MFGRDIKTVTQNPLKDANFLSIYVYVYIMCVFICLQAGWSRCSKTERSLAWVDVDRK